MSLFADFPRAGDRRLREFPRRGDVFRARNAVDLCVEILVLGSPRPRWEMDGDPVAFVS